MPGFGSLFGKGSIGEQLFVWGFLSQLVQALTNPGIAELTYLVNENTTVGLLSPAELAQLVNRGFIDQHEADGEGAKQGLSAGRMHHLTELAGEAPAPEALVEGLRRGIIDRDAAKGGLPSFVDGIRQGNLRNVWAPFMEQLAVQLPSWNDALDALLEGQLDRATALSWFKRAGGDPAAFDWLYNARGSAPTPNEAAAMANRGIIAWDGTGPGVVSYAQAFLEGPWRNKWSDAFRKLAEYHPPARTVVAMLRNGSITVAQATQYFRDLGMPADLAAAMVKEATAHRTTAQKELTRADIEQLLTEHRITPEQASSMLQRLGYTAEDAKILTSGVELKQVISNTNNAVTRIRSLFVAHRLDAAGAKDALTKLGMASAQAEALLSTWDVELKANVRPLTPAQIVDAWHINVMTQAEAQAELEHAGYTAFDAWVLLSIKNKAPLPDKPAGP